MTVKRVKLDAINVSDFAYTALMHQILWDLEDRSKNGWLLGELGRPNNLSALDYAYIRSENAVVRYDNLKITIKSGKVVIHADMTYIENDKFNLGMLETNVFMPIPRYIREANKKDRITSIVGFDLVSICQLDNDNKEDLVEYSDMMNEILSNGMADRIANWCDKLLENWELHTTTKGDTYRYYKNLITNENDLQEYHKAIILDYTDMVSTLIKQGK